MDAGVGGDQRSGGGVGDVPEAALVEVGEVDEDAKAVAGADEIEASRGEAGAGVWRTWEGERDTMAEDVGSAPDGAEAAEAFGVNGIEFGKVRAYGLSAFHVEEDGEGSVVFGLFDGGGGDGDADCAVRAGGEGLECGELGGDGAAGVVRVEGLGHPDGVGAFGGGKVSVILGWALGGNTQGEEAAEEASGAGSGKIEVAGGVSNEKVDTGRIGFRTAELAEAMDRVVMTVEDLKLFRARNQE